MKWIRHLSIFRRHIFPRSAARRVQIENWCGTGRPQILLDLRTMFKSLSLLALFAGGAEAFYLPGVNPQSFAEGET
jgi:hypothetical protein